MSTYVIKGKTVYISDHSMIAFFMLLRTITVYTFISVFCTISSYGASIDSLRAKLNESQTREQRIQTLDRIIKMHLNYPDSVIKYGQELLKTASDDDMDQIAGAKFQIGQAYKNKGAYELSIQYLFESLDLKNQLNQPVYEIQLLLGMVYSRIGDMEKSSEYFHALLDHPVDRVAFNVSVMNNFAESFYQNGMYDSSLHFFQKAFALSHDNEMTRFEQFIRGNIGMVNLKLGNLDSAELQLREVLQLFDSGSNSYISFKTMLAEVYLEKGDISVAESMIKDVVSESSAKDYKEQLRDAYRLLSTLYGVKQDHKKALESYQRYVEIDNKIKDVETVRKIGDMQTEFAVGQKQAELDLVNAERQNERLVTIGVSLLAIILLVLGLVILKYYRQKAKTNEELERLNQTKDKFFSIISHDLRGPVSSFFGISRLIKSLVKMKQTEQLLEIADDIDESVDRLSALLDNLLNWAMQQQGHFPNVPEKVNLNEVTQDLIRTLDTMAKGKSINLDSQIDGAIHLWVDKNTTMTILRNLVNNALKFTPEGGHVTIAASSTASKAEIKVQDSGVGIPEEKLKSLFKLQDKKSTYGTSGEKGLGLGLQLVCEFVEMNGGTIDVTSTVGEGTTFAVTLPLYDLEEEVITR